MTVSYIYRRRRWRLLFGFVDRVGAIAHRPREGSPDWTGVRSILVLKLDQAGDLVLTLPMLRALKEAAPGARLELAVGCDRRGVLEGVAGIDAVHELPFRMRAGETRNDIRRRALARAVRSLRARRFDAVVAAKEEPWTVLLSVLIGARIRVGYREGGLGFLLTHVVPMEPPRRHQWEILASLAGPDASRVGPPQYPVSAKAAAEAARIHAQAAGSADLPLVVVHPGAGILARTWPLARFMETVRLVCAEQPCVAVFTAGPDDSAAVPLPDLPAPSRAVRAPDGLPFPLFAALLARASVVLANESAPAHLAAAVGTPAVVPFLSGNDPKRWGPFGDRHAVIEGPRGIGPTPGAVAAAVLAALRVQDAAPPGGSTR